LLGADPSNSFVDWLYRVSYPFVAPFFGIFHTDINLYIGHFEVETLVALVVYGLAAGLIGALFGRRA
jgi:hypothetical protein